MSAEQTSRHRRLYEQLRAICKNRIATLQKNFNAEDFDLARMDAGRLAEEMVVLRDLSEHLANIRKEI